MSENRNKKHEEERKLLTSIFEWAIPLSLAIGLISLFILRGIPLAMQLIEYQINRTYSISNAGRRLFSMNYRQEEYYLKKQGFTSSLENLGFDPTSSKPKNYTYSVRVTERAAFHYVISVRKDLKSHVGAVFAVPDDRGKMTLVSIRCQAKGFGVIKPAEPYYQGGNLVCGEGTKKLGRQAIAPDRSTSYPSPPVKIQ